MSDPTTETRECIRKLAVQMAHEHDVNVARAEMAIINLLSRRLIEEVEAP